MATWITHLMIADRVLERVPQLDKKGFCVGNIAPDCNVENEDWTQFVPSREVTHWMSADRKIATDCERFYQEYIENRKHEIGSEQELAFLLDKSRNSRFICEPAIYYILSNIFSIAFCSCFVKQE